MQLGILGWSRAGSLFLAKSGIKARIIDKSPLFHTAHPSTGIIFPIQPNARRNHRVLGVSAFRFVFIPVSSALQRPSPSAPDFPAHERARILPDVQALTTAIPTMRACPGSIDSKP